MLKITAALLLAGALASCASAQQRLPGKLGKLINEPNAYKTKTYKSVYNRKINWFIKTIKIIDPDGTRSRREPHTAEPLLRIPVHFTVLHDGNKGKIDKATLQKQLVQASASFRGQSKQDFQKTCVNKKGNKCNVGEIATFKKQLKTKYAHKGESLDTGIEFVMGDAPTYVDDKKLHTCLPGGVRGSNEMAIKKKYTQNPHKQMNVIVCAVTFEDNEMGLGWSMFPQEKVNGKAISPNSKLWNTFIHYSTLPGQPSPDADEVNTYDEGDTFTHEIGHFFGLPHAFHEGEGKQCVFDNDQMKDTPVMKGSSQGCPRLRDSCKKAKGLDPIWNFMDYSDDACMYSFSKDQKRTMRASIQLFKKDLYKIAIGLGASPITAPKFNAKSCMAKFDKGVAVAKVTKAPGSQVKNKTTAEATKATTAATAATTNATTAAAVTTANATTAAAGGAVTVDAKANATASAAPATTASATSATEERTQSTSFEAELTTSSSTTSSSLEPVTDVGGKGFWFGDDDDENWYDGYEYDDEQDIYSDFEDDESYGALWIDDFWIDLVGTDKAPEPIDAAGSCKVNATETLCGLPDFDQECQCDATCHFFGDCCADYNTTCGFKFTNSTKRMLKRKARALDTFSRRGRATAEAEAFCNAQKSAVEKFSSCVAANREDTTKVTGCVTTQTSAFNKMVQDHCGKDNEACKAIKAKLAGENATLAGLEAQKNTQRQATGLKPEAMGGGDGTNVKAETNNNDTTATTLAATAAPTGKTPTGGSDGGSCSAPVSIVVIAAAALFVGLV